VKNSLQLAQSIPTTRATTLVNVEARNQVDEAASRLMTIAAVHHPLSAGGSVTMRHAAQYLRDLLSNMRGLLPDMTEGRISTLKDEPFMLAAYDNAPSGLITCELVTNALKSGRGRLAKRNGGRFD
jgi:two-component sensor histidine kinase